MQRLKYNRLPEPGTEEYKGFIKAVREWYKQSLKNTDEETREKNSKYYELAKQAIIKSGYSVKEFPHSAKISIQKSAIVEGVYETILV